MKVVRRLSALLCLFCLLWFVPTNSFAPQLLAQQTTPMKIVGYFPRYGLYSSFFVKNLITSGSAPLLTHLDYAFANVVNNKCVSFDTYADYQAPISAANAVSGVADPKGGFAGNFHQLQELKKLYPNLKIIMGIGGGSSNPNAFHTASLPANRQTFVQSCINMYIKGNFAAGISQPGIFDGFDIDWEYPAVAADRDNFSSLLNDFRLALNAIRPGLTLAIAGGNANWSTKYVNLNQVQNYLDYFGVMTYDYDGPWTNETGLVAPLYRSSKDPDSTNNASATIQEYLEAGVAPGKLVFGVPFYGYEWSNVPNLDNGLWEPGAPDGDGAAYNSIVNIQSNFKTYRDSITQSVYLFNGSHFWTYDDPTAIKFKMTYVKNQKLGGVMVWNLGQDLSNGTLLKTVATGLKP
jgi:chitinase